MPLFQMSQMMKPCRPDSFDHGNFENLQIVLDFVPGTWDLYPSSPHKDKLANCAGLDDKLYLHTHINRPG